MGLVYYTAISVRNHKFLITFFLANENLKFRITASRSIADPPSIQVTFSNGVQDELVLTQYKFNDLSTAGCNYLGRLRNDPESSVAVTGCLNNPGDKLEVTLLSENNINHMFLVDFYGNTEIIKSPFEDGGTFFEYKIILHLFRIIIYFVI